MAFSKRKESQFWDWNKLHDNDADDPAITTLNEKNLNSEIETKISWTG